MNNRYETLLVAREDGRLTITFNRPHVRNALNLTLVDEMIGLLTAVQADQTIRIVTIQGADGWFCAGGDLKEFGNAVDLPAVQVAANNRKIGTMLTLIDQLPQTVVMLVEGAAIGGGFGLVCTSDVAIGTADTRMSLSETTLGILPAQIAPFVVQRVGFSQARRLMLTAARFKGVEAERLGLFHFVVPDRAGLEEKAAEIIAQIEALQSGKVAE